MNFWLLALAMSNPPLGLLDVAGQLLELAQAVGHQVTHDLQEALLDQPLRAPDEQRRRIAGLGPLQEAAHRLEHSQGVVAGADLARRGRAGAVSGRGLTVLLTLALHAERRLAGLDQTAERLHERRQVERAGRPKPLVEERLDRHRPIVGLAHRRGHRPIAGVGGRDLGVQLTDRLGGTRVGAPRGEPTERHFDLARAKLALLAGVHEIAVAQVLDRDFGIDQRRHGVQPLGRIVVVVGLEDRVDALPVPLEQAVDQAEPRGQPRDALGARERPGQMDGDSKILAPVEDRLRPVDDLRPVGVLSGLDVVTGALLGLAAGRLLELEERQIVLEIGAAWRKLPGLREHRPDVEHQRSQMNEINCTLTRPLRRFRRPEASRNADPRPEGLRAHCTAIEPPRKCTEPMLLNPICQWRNTFGRACRSVRLRPGGRSRRGRRSGTHSIYEIKRYVYESSRQGITAGSRKDSELRLKLRLIPERIAVPRAAARVVSRLFNFRAVYHRTLGSNARGYEPGDAMICSLAS